MTVRCVVTEPAVEDLAEAIAQTWQASDCGRLSVGLRGGLGSGKTTFTRALLRGLGHTGRVPSPTYTLLEHYAVNGLVVVHLDLFRIGSDQELEMLGLRDWLDRDAVWIIAEWPERAPAFASACDLLLDFRIIDAERHEIVWHTQTPRGQRALESIRHLISSYGG